MGCFAVNLDINTSLHAEIFYVMHAIEIAYNRCWHMLWIESDPQIVVTTFKNHNIILWKLRTIWFGLIACS